RLVPRNRDLDGECHRDRRAAVDAPPAAEHVELAGDFLCMVGEEHSRLHRSSVCVSVPGTAARNGLAYPTVSAMGVAANIASGSSATKAIVSVCAGGFAAEMIVRSSRKCTTSPVARSSLLRITPAYSPRRGASPSSWRYTAVCTCSRCEKRRPSAV